MTEISGTDGREGLAQPQTDRPPAGADCRRDPAARCPNDNGAAAAHRDATENGAAMADSSTAIASAEACDTIAFTGRTLGTLLYYSPEGPASRYWLRCPGMPGRQNGRRYRGWPKQRR